jgi:hypothetical protein
MISRAGAMPQDFCGNDCPNAVFTTKHKDFLTSRFKAKKFVTRRQTADELAIFNRAGQNAAKSAIVATRC